MLKERCTTISIWAIVGLLYARDAALSLLNRTRTLSIICAGIASIRNTFMFNTWERWQRGLNQIRQQALGPIPQPEPGPAPNHKLDAVVRQASAYLEMLYSLPANQVYRLKLLARRVEAGMVSEWC